jgi:hypothetical protein
MVMTGYELIKEIVMRGIATPEQLPTPEQLQSKSVQELHEILDTINLAQIRADIMRSPEIVARQRKIDEINSAGLWMQFFFKHPELVDNTANRKLLFDYALSLSEDGVVRFQHMDEAAKTLSSGLARQKVKQPLTAQAKSNQEAADRAIFHEFCRENSFSEVAANWELVKSVLESGFDRYTLAQAVQSNALTLAPASPEELAQFRQEAIEIHNQRLLSMDIQTLRRLAREAGARGPAAPELDQVQKVRAASQPQFEPLPSTILYKGGEELLDRDFLLRGCDKDFYKYLLNRYGSVQLTARINDQNYFTRNKER